MTQTQSTARHRVVIIGSGFGGLFAAKKLKRADADVTVIARTSYHLFQPLLYQVATGVLSSGEVAPATREVLARQKNTSVLLGDVTDIDLDNRVVTSRVAGRVMHTPYDSLIVAAGSGQSYFGNDRFATFAPGMKSIDDALELRARIFGAFEMAELSDDPAEIQRLMTFVVVGAGPTGVEMAGQIAELAHRTLRRDFRKIDTTKTRILLLDGAPRILATFREKTAVKAAARLAKIGVEIRTGAMVTDMDATGITVRHEDGSEERVESTCKVWAAGVQASPLGRQLGEKAGADVDRAGRVAVNPDLTLPGHPEVFVVGDLAALALPGVAQVAIQGGKFAAGRINDRLKGKESDRAFSKPFHYFDKGDMATISRFSAIAEIGRFTFSGFVGWLLWLCVHLVYLTGFKSKVTTLVHWTVSFVGRGRSERVITEQQEHARMALEVLHEEHEHGDEPPPAESRRDSEVVADRAR
ncbi:MAG TPA: NAD(P)/FAD-dependent oxidoreductase [Nocardioidaceae bacterium]|nr:NAD(P)/FAD-dependent oxidoreductase [Nocardioidaceae bacterium]